jgi:hypothetical protein
LAIAVAGSTCKVEAFAAHEAISYIAAVLAVLHAFVAADVILQKVAIQTLAALVGRTLFAMRIAARLAGVASLDIILAIGTNASNSIEVQRSSTANHCAGKLTGHQISSAAATAFRVILRDAFIAIAYQAVLEANLVVESVEAGLAVSALY